jgi:carboxypeptidase family protein
MGLGRGRTIVQRTRSARWLVLALFVGIPDVSAGQSTTGTIRGTVRDQQGAVVPGVTVTIRQTDTNLVRTAATGAQGEYLVTNLPTGNYEVTAEIVAFNKSVRSGITLAVNQDAVVDVTLTAGGLTETISVTSDASVLNTTTAEVGVRFDTTRVSELPVINSRDVFSLALSAPGVNQLSSGQGGFASGVDYAVNGQRVRSNNMMVDGQDNNDPSVTGVTQPINNTDIVQEARLITNQFAAEYGRSAGSVMNVITKSGTNAFHGSGFVFHQNDQVNARTNLDKNAGKTSAPFFLESQYGGTVGGPIARDRAFFFGGFQRWTQRFTGSGFTLNGAPTEAGRQILQSAAGSMPQVQALLKHLPAAQTPIATTASFTRNGQTFVVPLGSLTGSYDGFLNSNQPNARVDIVLSPKHTLTARYLNNMQDQIQTQQQATPPGQTLLNDQNQHGTNVWLTSVLSARMTNEMRVAHQHLGNLSDPVDTTALEIPSIEISELGLTGFNAAQNRTALGIAVNIPQFRYNDTYQFQNTFTWVPANHALKLGVDFRHIYVKSWFVPTVRGRLSYPTLQRYIDDNAEVANINKPLPGGQEINYYEWNDMFVFFQDEWRARSNLTLSLGLRYELPGNTLSSLFDLNDNIVQATGDSRYALTPVPKRDTNNFQPRLGFNWSPRTRADGPIGWVTGGDKFVVRGGYARTNDYAFLNLALNVASSFPFVAAINNSNFANAFTRLPNLGFTVGQDPSQLTRTVVSEDFAAPSADQYSLELQRELTGNMVFRIGYVGTQGRGLYQTVDGNPRQPFCGNPCTTGPRVDPSRGVIRLRANEADSSYHSLQTGLEKRLSGGLSAGAHYTWSKFIDEASDTFNTSSGEVAIAQDSFNLDADRAVSAYDRPHRLTANVVYELPFARSQNGFVGRLAGGWTLSGVLTLQSGAPFTVLNGVDPTGAVAGIDGLVGNSIRPNLNTDLKLSKMTIEEIIAAGGRNLFRPLCGMPSAACAGERVGTVGRNTLRADGIGNLDLALIKNTRIAAHRLQIRVEMFNATNTRNFGIPEGRINNANFLNQWGTNGGSRTIWGALRYIF